MGVMERARTKAYRLNRGLESNKMVRMTTISTIIGTWHAFGCLIMRKQDPLRLAKMGTVLALAVAAWCLPIQAAEIHEAAELGDLDKLKASLARDPKQINTADAKG